MARDAKTIRAAAIGRSLRLLRKQRGLTQQDLADATDIDRSTIVALERGTRLNPQIDTLEPLALALGTTASALLSGGAQ